MMTAVVGFVRRNTIRHTSPRPTANHSVHSRVRMVAAAAAGLSSPCAEATRNRVIEASVTRRPPGRKDSAPATVVVA